MRILVCGTAQWRLKGQGFYNTEQKLANGFIRNGHNVLFLPVRELIRSSTIFRSSRVGIGRVNSQVLEFATGYQPHLVIIPHSSPIRTDTLRAIKALNNDIMIAQYCVDPLFMSTNDDYLMDRRDVVDATFMTTAGVVLERYASETNVVAYMPNPIDPSIEVGRAFEIESPQFDVFWAAKTNIGLFNDDPRHLFVQRLLDEPGITVDCHGLLGRDRLFGAPYFARLANSRMALNISLERSAGAALPTPDWKIYLYTSARTAQIMGSGVVAISRRVSRLHDLFEDGREMVFADSTDELVEVVNKLKRDNALRKSIGKNGWKRSHQDFNCQRVAQFIEDVTFRRELSQNYGWPTKVWRHKDAVMSPASQAA